MRFSLSLAARKSVPTEKGENINLAFDRSQTLFAILVSSTEKVTSETRIAANVAYLSSLSAPKPIP